MAIDETLTGTVTGASTSPTQTISDAIIEGNFTAGFVILEMQKPAGAWHTVASVRRSDMNNASFNAPVITADPATVYRFRCQNVVGNADVYLGP